MKTLLLILTLISFSSYGQGGKETHLPLYFDKELIHKSIDSLLKIHADEIIIIQTDKNFSYLYNLVIVTADKVYKTIKFDGQKLFNQKDKEKILVTEDELTLKFAPPLTNQNVFFYINHGLQGYFEQDNPATYEPQNKRKEELRKQWFDNCILTLQSIKVEPEINNTNDRQKKLDEGH